MTLAELDKALDDRIMIISENGLEDVLEIKMTLTEEDFKTIKDELLPILRDNFVNTYRNIHFDIGEKSIVKIVEKEKPEPTYRPFNDCDELIATWQKMMGYPAKANTMPLIWVKHKKTKNVCCINGFKKCDVFTLGIGWYSYEYMFDEYTFLDGSPFGCIE